jgi:signal transduction histidine kinase/DNA-binding NarL/FixJ family response regulator
VKKRLLFIVLLVLLFPWTALAAQEGLLPIAALVLPLVLVFVFAVAFGWLWQQWRRGISLQKEVLNQQQRLQKTFDLAPWPILMFDQQLRIVAANPEALRHLDHEDLVGGFFPEIVPQAATHPLLPALREGAVDQKDLANPVLDSAKKTDLRLMTVDGQHYGLWYGRHPQEQGERPSFSDLNQAEEAANRMKSEFIANINHEVRTPMNAIIGYTEMLASSPLEAKEKRFVEIIHKSSMALVSIFNDIMELSKIDSGRLQIMASSIRLDLLIGEIQGLYRDQAREKGITLECEIQNHLPKSYILDGARMKQILSNLVSNAIKFTNEGTVRLLVEGTPSATLSGCYDLRFIVEDTGMGITPKDQEKIFEVFRQREDTIAKRYGGVGLGLTLCSRLVALMGGRINLFSTVGGGSAFTVRLDGIHQADPVPEDQSESVLVEKEISQEVLTILVVDDVDLIKDVFVDFFQGSPHTIVTANTGEEALVLARSERPDLIFMDLNLSGSDGRTITEQIRQDPQLATTPVVVMTGEILDEEDYRPLFDGFLQKPFRLDALKELISRYVRSPAPRAEQAKRGGLGQEADDSNLTNSIRRAWNDELEQLLCQAIRSGSLTDAADLGAALSKHGKSLQDPVLMSLGEDLLQFTAEPDIMGVDRQLALMSRALDRKGL